MSGRLSCLGTHQDLSGSNQNVVRLTKCYSETKEFIGLSTQ